MNARTASGTYYQEDEIVQPGFGRGTMQLIRLSLTGKQKEPIENLQVKVTKIVPEQPGLRGVPFNLQRMNNNVAPYQYTTVLVMDQEEYFDVVSYSRFMLSTGQLSFRRIDQVSGEFDHVPCDVFVQITGADIRTIERCFRIWIDQLGNNLRMIPCS
jgi:hypothetical protein